MSQPIHEPMSEPRVSDERLAGIIDHPHPSPLLAPDEIRRCAIDLALDLQVARGALAAAISARDAARAELAARDDSPLIQALVDKEVELKAARERIAELERVVRFAWDRISKRAPHHELEGNAVLYELASLRAAALTPQEPKP